MEPSIQTQHSAALTEALISNIDACVFRIQEDSGAVVFVSEQITKLTGYSAKDFQNFRDIASICEGDFNQLISRHSSLLDQAGKWDLNFQLKHKDGSTIWVNSRGKRIDCGNSATCFDGVLIEVSDRYKNKIDAEQLRSQYERALDRSDTSIWEWNIETNEFYTNNSVNRWAEKEIQPITDTNQANVVAVNPIHPDYLDGFNAQIRASVVEGKEFYYEYPLREDPNVWVAAKGNVFRNAEGRAVLMSGTTVNITQKKRNEALIKDTATKLATVLNSSANPVARQLFNLGSGTIECKKLDSLLQLQSAEELNWKDLSNDNTQEAFVLDHSGTRTAVELDVTKSFLENEFIYTVLVRDITKFKQLLSDVVDAKDHAEAAAKVKSEFLAIMSHEIRTPMNGIMGMAQLLLDAPLSEDQRESMQVILSSGETLLSLLNYRTAQ